MNLKLLKIVDVFLILLLSVLLHFVYNWWPNTLFSIFFPVNESIWEHVKLLYTSIVIFGIVDFIFLKIFKINFHNFITSLFLSSSFAVILFLIIYIPLFNVFGNNTVINIIVLVISIIASQIISYFVLREDEYPNLNYISLIGIILIYIVFGILTYHPLKNEIFYDFSQNKYGLNVYDI